MLALSLALLLAAGGEGGAGPPPEKPAKESKKAALARLRTGCYGPRDEKPLATIARDHFRRRGQEALQRRDLKVARQSYERLLRGHEENDRLLRTYLALLGDEDAEARKACAELLERFYVSFQKSIQRGNP